MKTNPNKPKASKVILPPPQPHTPHTGKRPILTSNIVKAKVPSERERARLAGGGLSIKELCALGKSGSTLRKAAPRTNETRLASRAADNKDVWRKETGRAESTPPVETSTLTFKQSIMMVAATGGQAGRGKSVEVNTGAVNTGAVNKSHVRRSVAGSGSVLHKQLARNKAYRRPAETTGVVKPTPAISNKAVSRTEFFDTMDVDGDISLDSRLMAEEEVILDSIEVRLPDAMNVEGEGGRTLLPHQVRASSSKHRNPRASIDLTSETNSSGRGSSADADMLDKFRELDPPTPSSADKPKAKTPRNPREVLDLTQSPTKNGNGISKENATVSNGVSKHKTSSKGVGIIGGGIGKTQAMDGTKGKGGKPYGTVARGMAKFMIPGYRIAKGTKTQLSGRKLTKSTPGHAKSDKGF